MRIRVTAEPVGGADAPAREVFLDVPENGAGGHLPPEHLDLGNGFAVSVRLTRFGASDATARWRPGKKPSLTRDQIGEMRALLAGGMKQREVGERFLVSQITVSRAVRGIGGYAPGETSRPLVDEGSRRVGAWANRILRAFQAAGRGADVPLEARVAIARTIVRCYPEGVLFVEDRELAPEDRTQLYKLDGVLVDHVVGRQEAPGGIGRQRRTHFWILKNGPPSTKGAGRGNSG